MPTLTLLSYNLDLIEKPKDVERRIDQLMADVASTNPSVIAIQGGHPSIYDYLFKHTHKLGMKRYIPEQFRNSTFSDVILTTHNVVKTEFLPFYHTGEGLGITASLLDVDGEDVWIATCRMEQEAERAFNKPKQLAYLTKAFQEPRVIFAGDTNIPAYQKNCKLDEGWYDAWIECGKASNELTYDYTINTFTPPPFRDRPDRVLYRGVECDSFSLVGTGHLAPTSSHLGIVCNFSW